MTKRTFPFSPEVRERTVRTMRNHGGEHRSQWSAIYSITAKIGCSGETLRNRVRQSERYQGVRPGQTTNGRERIKALEREVRELRQANEIPRKASAYFAMAELDPTGFKGSTRWAEVATSSASLVRSFYL